MPTSIVNNISSKELLLESRLPLSIAIGKFFVKFLKNDKRAINIITSSVFDAIRLKEEISWFYPDLNVNLLPDWETLPFDQISPHPDLTSERLLTLYQMTQKEFDINLLPISTVLHRMPPRAYIEQYSFQFKKGDTVDIKSFKDRLIENGYLYVDKVINPGEYAMRGGIIDLFPMGSTLPYRIDFFDNEIDSIRTFDADTQRSLYPVNEIKLLPAKECPLDERGITAFRQNYREKFEGDPSKSKIYKAISKGIPFAGMEWYLPLFYDTTNTIFDYLNPKDITFKSGNLAASAQNYWNETEGRFKLYAYDAERPILSPEDFLLRPDIFFKSLNDYPELKRKSNELLETLPDLGIDRTNKFHLL